MEDKTEIFANEGMISMFFHHSGIIFPSTSDLQSTHISNGKCFLGHNSFDICNFFKGVRLNYISMKVCLVWYFTILISMCDLISPSVWYMIIWWMFVYRELAVDMLQMIPDSDVQLAQLCARCAASMDEINLLHEKVQLILHLHSLSVFTRFFLIWFDSD